MSYYLVEVDDTKEGVCYPTFVGPFATHAAAAEFASKYDMGQQAVRSGAGGYSDVHVVGPDTATSPDRYAADYAWRLEDE